MKILKFALIPLICIMLIAFAMYKVQENAKEYIGGNVLNIPFPTTSYYEVNNIMPWTNTGLVSHLSWRTLYLANTNLIDMSPDLALNEPEIINNGLEYRIELKENQKWSDGTIISIDDVIYSIENIQIATQGSSIHKNTFAKIEKLEKDGNVLIIKMKERTTMLRPMLAQLAILPSHLLKNEDQVNLHLSAFWQNPVVSGMYKYSDEQNDEYIELIHNENYTGGMSPKIEIVRIHYKSDEKLDYYLANNFIEMLDLRAMRGFTEYNIDMLFYRYLIFNIAGIDGNQNMAMQDIRVRQAISMALDRHELLKDAYFNIGNVVNGTGADDSNSPYAYNPENAKILLKQANYDYSRPLRIAYYYTDISSFNFLKKVKTYLEEVGFIVELVDRGGAENLYSHRNYDVLLKGLASFEASEWYGEYSSKHAFLPFILGGDGKLDSLINEVIGETDKEKHALLLQELHSQEEELLYKFPLFTLSQALYLNTNRIKLPQNIKFGNYLYVSDIEFDKWEIKKQ